MTDILQYITFYSYIFDDGNIQKNNLNKQK